MATLHLIYGFVGAGKTTYARALEKQTNAIRFSPDEWMVRLYGGNGLPREQFDDYVQRIDALVWEQTTTLLSRGVDVIFDHGFWSRASRDEARALAANIGADIDLVYVRPPDEATLVARVLRRSAEPGQLFIDENAIEFFRTRFEPLGPDEAHRIVTTQDAA